MEAMFSNNQQSVSHCNRNQPLSSSFFPFMDEPETLIFQQQKKKSRLASWGCSDGSLNQVGDIRYNTNPSLASSISPFFQEHQTLISQQNTKKPRLEAPWWSVDKSLDQLSVIFTKPPPITSNSTAGVSNPPPITSNSTAGFSNPPRITLNSTAGVLKPPPITSNSTVGFSKPPPEVILIDDHEIEEEIPESNDFIIYEDELIEEEIPKLSDFIFDNNTPPIASLSSFVISKSPPEVIIIDDEEEEEIVAMSNDNNQKLDSEGSKSVVFDREEKNNNGVGDGFGRVTVYDLGVTVEDLKNIPWEAFDPSLGIKSVMMDPSFGWICSTHY